LPCLAQTASPAEQLFLWAILVKTYQLLAAIGALVLGVSNASATVDSSSFVVSITIESPCGASMTSLAGGIARHAAATDASSAVTVTCHSKTTPYSVALHAANKVTQTADPIVPSQQDVDEDAFAGYTTATITF
jgi:hypothetical protein